MRFLHCLCGARIEAPDAGALASAYVAHLDAAHANMPLSGTRRADLIARVRRTGGWDGERRPLPGDVTFRALAPALAADYLGYFDDDAFSDNPAWAGCYCLSYEADLTPQQYDERTAAENRAEKGERIARGEAGGVLAYAGGRVVGWCNAQPRRALPLLDRTPEYATADPERPGAIVCFAVPPAYRGQGLAARLLDAACAMLREQGCTSVEAFPPAAARTAAASYHGSLKMYEAAGFERVRDAGHYVMVRKAL